MKMTIIKNLNRFCFCSAFTLIFLTSYLALGQTGKPASDPAKSRLNQIFEDKIKVVKLPTAESDLESLRVLSSIVKQAGWFPDIKLTMQDGMVTIEGQANTKEQLDWLTTTAERLPSVIAIINKAELKTTALTDLSPAANEVRRMVDTAKRAMPNILLAFGLFLVLILLNRFLNRGIHTLWEKRISNPFLLSTVSKLSLLPIWLLFFYLILRTAGLSSLATTIIGGTGMLGLVLGLAFRGIAENYLAGLLLAMRSPFTKGDLIEIGENLGYVQNLSMRGTTIIDLDGNLILIPNSTVIQSVVQNRTANPLTRTSFTVGISYADSISKAQEIIIKSMRDVRGVLHDPEVSVIADSLGASSVNLKVMFWFNIKETNQPRVRSRAMIHIKESLLANGITMPDEGREVVFADTLKVQMLESKEQAKSHEEERKHGIKEQAEVNLQERRNNPEAADETQGKDLMRLAEANPLLTERPKDNLLKP